jgi:hypothetical protein
MAAPVITPNRTLFINGETPILMSSNQPARWTVNDASLFTNAAATSPYTLGTLLSNVYLFPDNKSTFVNVVATNSGNESSNPLTVTSYGKFPLQPIFGYDIDIDDKTLISVAEDGTTVRRLKGIEKRVWTLQMPNRPLSEYITLRNFFLFHRKLKEFYYEDLAIQEMKIVQFDSGIKVTPNNHNSISMSCVVREV